MSMIFLAKGICTLGRTQRDRDGNITSSTPAKFTWDSAGGSIAIGEMAADSKEIKEDSVSIFGDWDAAGYLQKVLELLKPRRKINIPDLKAIVQTAYREDGNDLLCDYCQIANCQDCIIREWKEEA